MLLDARLELRHHRFVSSEAEQPLDPSLDRLEAQLLETMDLGLGELRERELAERRAAPEGERFLERRERRLRIIVEESPSFGRELLEPAGVDAGVVDPEQVPGGPGLEWAVLSGLLEDAAEVGDIALDGLCGRARGLLPPQRVHERVGRDHLATPEEEHREQRALAASWKLDPTA